jgi:hypothetical protein
VGKLRLEEGIEIDGLGTQVDLVLNYNGLVSLGLLEDESFYSFFLH